MSDVKRPSVPDLEFRAPDCPMCSTETGCDGDSFVCPDCGATWSRDGQGGEWDEDKPGCPAVIEPHNRPNLAADCESIRHLQEQCYLAGGHAGKHFAIDGWSGWTDDDPRVLVRGDESW